MTCILIDHRPPPNVAGVRTWWGSRYSRLFLRSIQPWLLPGSSANKMRRAAGQGGGKPSTEQEPDEEGEEAGPPELERISLLEPAKQLQNSCTILRRIGRDYRDPPIYTLEA